MPRFYCPVPLATGAELSLPAGAARHVQVLRMQPGGLLTLFNGDGGEFDATVQRMGRSDVDVQIGTHHAVEREAPLPVHLVVGMPANERMDWLVEKATELGVASIQPVTMAHSVLRLKADRADKKVAHWRSIAVAACEQCGRNRVPLVHEVLDFAAWIRLAKAADAAITPHRIMLSLRPGTRALAHALADAPSGRALQFLSGPEGGLAAAEENAAIDAGFTPVTLGPRTLRAETAPLAALAALNAWAPAPA